MTATLACPSCHTRLKLPDRITGRRLKCPKCGSAVSVPPADTDHPAAGQQPRSTILPPLLIGGGVLAVLLFAVVVTILHPVQQSVDPVVAGSSPVALAFMEPSPILVQPDADGRGSVRNVLPRCLVDTDGHQGSCARQPLSRQTGGVLEDIANPLVMNLLHPLGSHQPACATRGTGCRRHRQRRRMASSVAHPQLLGQGRRRNERGEHLLAPRARGVIEHAAQRWRRVLGGVVIEHAAQRWRRVLGGVVIEGVVIEHAAPASVGPALASWRGHMVGLITS
jgi:hypothetical protein